MDFVKETFNFTPLGKISPGAMAGRDVHYGSVEIPENRDERDRYLLELDRAYSKRVAGESISLGSEFLKKYLKNDAYESILKTSEREEKDRLRIGAYSFGRS